MSATATPTSPPIPASGGTGTGWRSPPTAAVIVSGRSDATLNRHGVRLGSADIYDVVEKLPEVQDSLVVGAELADGGYWLALFVVPADGVQLTDEVVGRIPTAIRTQVSPRHVPDDVLAVTALPRTLTGKLLEIPIKRILLGAPPGDVVSPSAVDRPELLQVFAEYARP